MYVCMYVSGMYVCTVCMYQLTSMVCISMYVCVYYSVKHPHTYIHTLQYCTIHLPTPGIPHGGPVCGRHLLRGVSLQHHDGIGHHPEKILSQNLHRNARH